MTTPGTQIVSRAAPPSRGGEAQTGTWHIVGLAERGPTDESKILRSLVDFDKHFGSRVSYGCRDSVETYFRNGGVAVNMVRVVGPAAAKATIAFDGAAAALSISVDSVGEGASTLSASVDVLADGRFVISVYESTALLSASPPLNSPAEAAAWSESDPYIRVRVTGSVNPVAAAATALAGGDDDRASITDTHRLAALANLSTGTGQVSIPGATTDTVYAGLAAHAEANNRFALLDALPGTATELIDLADSGRDLMTDAQTAYAFFVEGWHLIPGIGAGAPREVPPSSVVAALMAKQDVATGNPNEPAAGIHGIATFSLGVNRAEWTDTERGSLNEAGVNVFRRVAGTDRLYGYRTMVDPNGSESAWVSAANARLRMVLTAEADAAAEAFVFSQITATKVAEYHGVLAGLLLKFYNTGALFGESPEEAFVIDTGTTVNTIETIAERRLSAVVGVRMSEFAEIVYLEFVKIPITEELS